MLTDASTCRREPMKSLHIVPGVVLLAAASALLSGCGPVLTLVAALAHNPDKEVKARHDLTGKSVAVIPFVHQKLPPFKTEGGMLLADTLEGCLRLNVIEIRIVPVGAAQPYLRETPAEDVDYRHVAQMLGADIVIHGEITDIDLADSLNRITAKVHVEA